MSPKRAWRKKLIIEWLKRHYVSVPTKTTKVELLELAFDNLPRKRYVVDEVAANHDIDIIRLVFALSNIYLLYKNVFRLAVKHCMFNPIELAWASLKNYVRDNNINFRLSDVRYLAEQWMTSLDAKTATAYLDHARNIENTFQKADSFIEQIKEEIVDEDEEIDSEVEETFD
jgi:transposase